jgi:hypothetical protein
MSALEHDLSDLNKRMEQDEVAAALAGRAESRRFSGPRSPPSAPIARGIV